MGVLTADLLIPYKANPTKFSFAAASADIFFKGALVYLIDAGAALPVPAAGSSFCGICCKQVDAGTGDEVECFIDGTFLMPYTTPAAGNEGELLFCDLDALSDNPADMLPMADISLANGDILIGRIIRNEGTSGWVTLMPGLVADATPGIALVSVTVTP
jgi:hypothetical protein